MGVGTDESSGRKTGGGDRLISPPLFPFPPPSPPSHSLGRAQLPQALFILLNKSIDIASLYPKVSNSPPPPPSAVVVDSPNLSSGHSVTVRERVPVDPISDIIVIMR